MRRSRRMQTRQEKQYREGFARGSLGFLSHAEGQRQKRQGERRSENEGDVEEEEMRAVYGNRRIYAVREFFAPISGKRRFDRTGAVARKERTGIRNGARRRIPNYGGPGREREAFFPNQSRRLRDRRSDNERYGGGGSKKRGPCETEIPVREIRPGYRHAAPTAAHGDDSQKRRDREFATGTLFRIGQRERQRSRREKRERIGVSHRSERTSGFPGQYGRSGERVVSKGLEYGVRKIRHDETANQRESRILAKIRVVRGKRKPDREQRKERQYGIRFSGDGVEKGETRVRP